MDNFEKKIRGSRKFSLTTIYMITASFQTENCSVFTPLKNLLKQT